jgi:uncharacterized cupredoxin-like copper-binding protein
MRVMRWRSTVAAGLVAVAAAVLPGCGDPGGSSDDAVAEVGVIADGTRQAGTPVYSFELPDTVPAGTTRFSLVNNGDELHHAQLFKLRPEATVDELASALATGDPQAALELGAFEGGTALVPAGETSAADAVVDLTAGTYTLMCFVPGPDRLPHLAHGMLRPFEVTGEGSGGDPAADAAAELSDYRFDVPGTVAPDAVLRVTNTATAEPHEMIVARLDGGADVDTVRAALERGDPMPATAVGGMQAILPGATQHLQLDVRPGRYVLVCEIPSSDGVAHSLKGMIAEVRVT